MSELIDNRSRKQGLMKHLMLQLHRGEAPQAVRAQLSRLMGEVPYDQVVEVEQELLADGLPASEILKFCDIHTDVLKGKISQEGAKVAPEGHPVHTFREENRALAWEIQAARKAISELLQAGDDTDPREQLEQARVHFHALTDVAKHYERKEQLLFPYLEKHGITGPSKVMWAKDDEARALLDAAVESLAESAKISGPEAKALAELVLNPALKALDDMIYREEEVLFPMSLDVLSDAEWLAVDQQSLGIGYCLYDPQVTWRPADAPEVTTEPTVPHSVQLPSGILNAAQLHAILSTIPFDLTFVDAEDRVRYFTQGRERIFTRTRAILGRKVQLCHPPSSVHIVETILDDFRSGRQSRAAFWINMKGKFIHIEYFALRDEAGTYLGTLEVSQDLTAKRALEGERRLLQYESD